MQPQGNPISCVLREGFHLPWFSLTCLSDYENLFAGKCFAGKEVIREKKKSKQCKNYE